MQEKKEVVSPCGLDCYNCELYVDNITEKLIGLLHGKMAVAKEEIPCRGCRSQDGKHFHLDSDGCATLDCVKAKGVDFCSNCPDYPCAYLAPTADGASRYPHNMKVYNLCRIKAVGIDKWMEEVGDIRRKYFTAKFVVGKGQAE